MYKPQKSLLSSALLMLMAGAATAGSFSLYTESNGTAVGNFGAGVAAEAADASTGWYNPAGLALIHDEELLIGGVGVFPVSKLTGSSTFSTEGLSPNYVQTFSGIDGARDALVPSVHFSYPLGESTTAGLSIVAPFGLKTDWARGGPVRYAATLSELTTVNISPELGGALNQHLALGAGLDLQYSKVKFNQMLGAPTLMQAFSQLIDIYPSFLDSESYNQGESFGIGFHAGVLTMFNNNHTRIGLNYQSQMKHRFHGYSRLIGRLAVPGLNVFSPTSLLTSNAGAVAWSNHLLSNDINFPEIVTLSAYQDVNENLALLGSVVYTGWSSLKSIGLIKAIAYAPPSPPLPGRQVLLSSTSVEDYQNAWRAAVGANYYFNEQWMVRVGGGYDESPITNARRSIRVPDADRWALAIGTHYQMYPQLGIDIGYTHLFAPSNPGVNRTDIVGTGSTYTVNADVKAHADLVGAALTWTIDKEISMPIK